MTIGQGNATALECNTGAAAIPRAETAEEVAVMPFRMHHFICLSILAFGLSACARSGFQPERFNAPEAGPPSDLTIDPSTGTPMNDPLTANPEQNVATVDNTGAATAETGGEPGTGVAIGRTDMLGGWKVAAGSDSCELFMSLTGWAGGYRAITKGCASDVLADVQAWNLDDREVVLLSGNGDRLARLYATTKMRFNGQTEDGIGVTVFR